MTGTRRVSALMMAPVVAAFVPLAACGPAPTPTPVPTTATPTPTASGTVSSPAAELDLTAPGVARAVVDDLMEAAGADRAVLVSVTQREATVAVVKNGAAEAWGYRGGTIAPVRSDVNYVAQAFFSPDDFALDDVGALFRAGMAVSGSDAGQELSIVDYSGGYVAMTVTTNPESRTVFFNPDGTLLPTLEFGSAEGLAQGYREVVGDRTLALQLGFGTDLGVYLDAAGAGVGTTTRRQRAARTPVIVTTRNESATLATFNPQQIEPAVVWKVVRDAWVAGEFTYDQPWSCVADDRAGTGTPRLYFQVGSTSFTTDLSGRRLVG